MARAPRRPRRRTRGGVRVAGTAPALGVALLAASAMVVLTATNSVSSPRLDHDAQTITAQALAPAACAGLGLTNKVTGGASGGTGNDLIVGTAADDNLQGNAGNDCILAGGGSDAVGGGAGTDYCDGGPGIGDSLSPALTHGCETFAGIP